MDKKTITITGCGKMGEVILNAVTGTGLYRVRAVEKDKARQIEIKEKTGVETYSSVTDCDMSDIYVFAVKPQDIKEAAVSLKKHPRFEKVKPLVISIAAGIKSEDLSKLFFGAVPVIRVMPNTPALIGEGVSAVQKDIPGVSKQDYDLAAGIFSAMGEVIFIDGDNFDAVTALSGSGPAYFFYLAEIMREYALKEGFEEKQASLIAFKTILGAARLMEREYSTGGKSFTKLKEDVTSPGGTTEAALKILAEKKFGSIFKEALKSAALRSEEISGEMEL